MEKNFNEFLERLKKLEPNSKPHWGKMTPQHMVEHLVYTFHCSNGKLKVKCLNSEKKLPVLKRFLLSNRELPKDFVNPVIDEGLMPLEFNNLEEAYNALIGEIESHKSFYFNNPEAKTINPTFGELNSEEWEIFHRKHFTHHLKQFGLIE